GGAEGAWALPALDAHALQLRKLMETIVLARSASMRDRIAMYNVNALKIGIFGANCSSGRSATKVPERWSASWPDCRRLARMADEAGIDFMLPIGRWKGYGGDTDFHGSTLETITWAVGLLSATERMTVFRTVHAPLFHPLIAAKEFVTADQLDEGRFGVNLVVGWNYSEFAMFGVTQREHDARYDFAQEWLDVVKRAWLETRRFRFPRTVPRPQGRARLPQTLRRHAADHHECRLLGSRPGLCVAQLRCVLRGDSGLANVARGQCEEGRRDQERGAKFWPRHRDLHGRAGDLSAKPEGGGGLLPPRHHRERRLGCDRWHARE